MTGLDSSMRVGPIGPSPVGPSTAFLLSGRSMMTVLTAPCRSTRTDMMLASVVSAAPSLGACQIGIEGSPGCELGAGVRHPEIIHGERGLPGAPIGLARVEVDLAAREVGEARAGARDVGPYPER